MNDHLHPLFAKILNDAASRPDTTPPGAVPVPAALPAAAGPAYGSRAQVPRDATASVCGWCQGPHNALDCWGNPARYCSTACELAEDGY